MLCIGIDKLQVTCIIGCLPEERLTPQVIFIDLKVKIERSQEAEDLMGSTIDYRNLATMCEACAVQGKFMLIESYVESLLKQIREACPVNEIWIKVTKPRAIKIAEGAYVEVQWSGH